MGLDVSCDLEAVLKGVPKLSEDILLNKQLYSNDLFSKCLEYASKYVVQGGVGIFSAGVLLKVISRYAG